MKNQIKLMILGIGISGSAILLNSCDKGGLLAPFKNNTEAKFTFVDKDPLSAAPIVVETAVDIVKLDSVLRANNSSRNDIRNFFLDKVNVNFDISDTSGNFDGFTKLEIFIQADSSGKSYPEVLVANVDSIGADHSRTVTLNVYPTKDLIKYIQGENIKFKAIIYPRDIETKTSILKAFVNYSGKAKVTK